MQEEIHHAWYRAARGVDSAIEGRNVEIATEKTPSMPNRGQIGDQEPGRTRPIVGAFGHHTENRVGVYVHFGVWNAARRPRGNVSLTAIFNHATDHEESHGTPTASAALRSVLRTHVNNRFAGEPVICVRFQSL
jgi:hypothetical protein